MDGATAGEIIVENFTSVPATYLKRIECGSDSSSCGFSRRIERGGIVCDMRIPDQPITALSFINILEGGYIWCGAVDT